MKLLRILALSSQLSALSYLTGCVTTPVKLNHADRLISRPDFRAAAHAAPDWVSDALKTINRLEQELERQ